jgi:pyrroline-5-carboxylate reductase
MKPDELVAMVSSPGGTTLAGRSVLEDSNMKEIIARTVSAASDRSRELGR